MGEDPDTDHVAGALRVSFGLLLRRVRQEQADGELTVPEISVLGRLERGGPATASALAKLEQISPQSVGATLGGLEERGLVERRPDPEDGRRAILSATDAGLLALRNRRTARTEQLARALSAGFTRAEREQLLAAAPLIERLADML